jgi:hypothetical protein
LCLVGFPSPNIQQVGVCIETPQEACPFLSYNQNEKTRSEFSLGNEFIAYVFKTLIEVMNSKKSTKSFHSKFSCINVV